jgi:peptide-methionine (S)-S-oxide reductase
MSVLATSTYAAPETDTAIFAGGCFWCLEAEFEKIPGVTKVISGYIGGDVPNPTYLQVSAGGTGHVEAVKVYYDPSKINYTNLLNVFWRNIDPTDATGQFCDTGSQYRAAIFYETDEQAQLAQTSKQQLIDSGRFPQIATQILPAKTFYPAEAYHQDYYKKNPLRYQFYRFTCGRDKKLHALWDD